MWRLQFRQFPNCIPTEWLERYAQFLPQHPPLPLHNNNSSNNNSPSFAFPLMHCIVRAALQAPLDCGGYTGRILEYALLSNSASSGVVALKDESTAATITWHNLGFAAGYVRAVDSLLACWGVGNANANANPHADQRATLLFKVLQRVTPYYGGSRSSSTTNGNASTATLPSAAAAVVAGKAVLGALGLLMNHPARAALSEEKNKMILREEDVAYLEAFYQLLQSKQQSVPKTSIPVASATATTTTAPSSYNPLEESVSRIVSQQAVPLLARLLQLSCPAAATPTILGLVQILYESCPDVQCITGMMLRGKDPVALLQQQLQQQQQRQHTPSSTSVTGKHQDDTMSDDTDDDDEDDDEEDLRRTARTSVVFKATTHSSGSLTKPDVSTLSKLDRLHASRYSQWNTSCWNSILMSATTTPGGVLSEDVILAAQCLSSPEQWRLWLSPSAAASSLSNSPEPPHANAVLLLASLLQHVTCLKPQQNSNSPFLSALAFSTENILNQLWSFLQQYEQQQKQLQPRQHPTLNGNRHHGSNHLQHHSMLHATYYAGLSVFCDIFSHHLIPLHDHLFLQQYCQSPMTENGASSLPMITAFTVIVKLKEVLYELYWNTPVRVDDFRRSDRLPYARLLLTGTKLWTLLYERWCRLLRHAQFCEESAWWFPALLGEHVTIAGAATSSSSEQDDHHHHDVAAANIRDLDAMEDDDDDDDVEMHARRGDDQETDALANAFRDARMARILTYIPQALPLERRVRIFQSLVQNDKMLTQDEDTMARMALWKMRGEDFDLTSGQEEVQIRRDALYSDAMHALNTLGRRLRRRVQVTFVNQLGAQEAGIDGGGVFKEFIDDLIKDAFSTQSSSSSSASSSASHASLFQVVPSQTLAINTAIPLSTELLSHYEFLGRVLGKAVYESILVDPQFCLPFLNQLLGKRNSLEDLKNYDYEYYKNLTQLLSLPGEEVDQLGLTFELTLGSGRHTQTVELIGGGRQIHVTKQNVIQYVRLVAYQRLNVESAAQTKAFLRGFRDLIPASWLRLFSAYELQKLISGDDRGIDVKSLQDVMQYASGYHPSKQIMQWFWEIVFEMTTDQQRKLLKFMTTFSRQPLLGFASLEPLPCVQQIRIPDALRETTDMGALAKETPLPTASTFLNILKLPNYPNKQLMKWKLLTAIEAGAGFELA